VCECCEPWFSGFRVPVIGSAAPPLASKLGIRIGDLGWDARAMGTNIGRR
jgi:hypothetical protein